MNQFQRAAADVYGGGDYAHITDKTEAEADTHGDTLFTFIMRELGDEPTWSMDQESAVQRMENAIRELQEVLEAIQ
jgi:hypothetical protein